MRGYFLTSLAIAVLIAATGTGFAQSRGESAAQNVRESEQYDRLICGNPAFRAKRIAQECGPLQGSQFYNGCVASFHCGGAAPSGANWRRAPASETVR